MKIGPKFDKELSVRNAAWAAFCAWLLAEKFGSRLGITKEAAVAIGIIVGPTLDALIFRVKAWVAIKKAR